MTLVQFTEIENKPKIIRSNQIVVELPTAPVRYYRHGWQSWSLAAWTDLTPLPTQMPVIYHTLQVDKEYVHEKKPNGSWLGAVEFEDGNILLLGALGLETHVTLDGNQLSGQVEAGDEEWFIAYGQEKTVFEEYTEQLGNHLGIIPKNHVPRVWCSWYSLYTAIDEPILQKVFEQLGDLPFDVLQVDDGWQKDIGDWEANEKFPAGMQALAESIKSTGRKAGLWLAPVIASKTSNLFQKHKDWFLHDEHGKLVSAGFNWGEHIYALDTTQPAVTEWLAALMKQVRAWGFDYLKLDFLYAGALRGKRYKDIPRETAYRAFLKLMREAMGVDAFFLTCGTPIIPALGVCDAIRIGPDVADQWESQRDAVLLYNLTTPGTKNAIRTVTNRLWLKPLLHIDPDVVYFTGKENSLTEEQKSLLQDLALVCEFKATSDLPQWMTPEERENLKAFLEASPKVKSADRYIFHLDDHLVDFEEATSLPEPPKGFMTWWAALLGWLGSMPFVLRIFKMMDDNTLKKRRAGL